MADRSGIEWTDSTFNAWMGCTKVSPACDHCYAADHRAVHALGIQWGAGQPRRRTSVANWTQPRRWNDQAFGECRQCRWRGEMRECRSVPHPDDQTPVRGCPTCNSPCVWPARRRVFCSSLADVFDNEVDPTWRRDLFELILHTPNLDWLLLTKRIGNVPAMLEDLLHRSRYHAEWAQIRDWLDGKPPANVWLGATICNQVEADRDIPKLLSVPAAVRFLSIEPLLGEVNLFPSAFLPCVRAESVIMDPTTGAYECCRECDYTGVGNEMGIDWIIAGGESGGAARPMHPDWVRSLRDQCASAGVPFLFKQWGEWGPIHQPLGCTAPLSGHAIKGDWPMLVDLGDPHGGLIRCGKKNAGRVLDGVEHNGFPLAPAVAIPS